MQNHIFHILIHKRNHFSIEKTCFASQTTGLQWTFAEVGAAARGVGYMTQTTVSSLGLSGPIHTLRSPQAELRETVIG